MCLGDRTHSRVRPFAFQPVRFLRRLGCFAGPDCPAVVFSSVLTTGGHLSSSSVQARQGAATLSSRTRRGLASGIYTRTILLLCDVFWHALPRRRQGAGTVTAKSRHSWARSRGYSAFLSPGWAAACRLSQPSDHLPRFSLGRE